MNIKQPHQSVLLKEVLEALSPKDNEVFIDATFGAGGYTKAILQLAKCSVIGLDRDETVEKFVGKIKEEFGDRFRFIRSPFAFMEEKIEQKVDGIVLDLGVSSMQLDEEDRGFSFSSSEKLDMRMDRSLGISAFEVINDFAEAELSKIIRDYGEEQKHRQIAKRIVEVRGKGQIKTCLELAEIVKKIYGFQSGKIHPATKTFQAIRIFVNDELGQLEKALEASKKLLKKDGRLVVVSFHSLEDSLVKNFLRKESGYSERNISRYGPQVFSIDYQKVYEFFLPRSSSIKPSEEEMERNIRSRSARLRLAIKT
ncbi:MAG: rRNA methyltransferase [Rickettsiaceae bacterium]|nr:rRNA methyltransferase [Rickettsiaceae bacterium]